MIEDGKVTQPIKGAMLIGNGPDAMHRVSMVGNDLEARQRHRHVRQGRTGRAGRRSASRTSRQNQMTLGGDAGRRGGRAVR